MTVAIKYKHAEYRASVVSKCIMLYARPGRLWRNALFSHEESALHWLSDHSLKRSKAKQLLDAAIRGEGPLADPDHHLRVKEESLAIAE